MNAITTYEIISAVLLAFIAAIWSTASWTNIIVKAVFTGAALFGAVCIAKNFV